MGRLQDHTRILARGPLGLTRRGITTTASRWPLSATVRGTTHTRLRVHGARLAEMRHLPRADAMHTPARVQGVILVEMRHTEASCNARPCKTAGARRHCQDGTRIAFGIGQHCNSLVCMTAAETLNLPCSHHMTTQARNGAVTLTEAVQCPGPCISHHGCGQQHLGMRLLTALLSSGRGLRQGCRAWDYEGNAAASQCEKQRKHTQCNAYSQ